MQPGTTGKHASRARGVWIEATRPRTLPAAVAPVLAGSALAWSDGAFAAVPAVLCLLFALLVQVGTNFANDYYDFIKGADTAARVGPRRAVAAGLIKPATMRAAMIAVFGAAFLVGCGLLPYGGWPLLVIGVTSIAAGYAYTGGPWPLAYLGLGDVFVFLFFGLVAVTATYALQAHAITADTWLVATAIGLLATNILVVNNYRDVETDGPAGKRTLVVRLGRGFAAWQFRLSLLCAFVVPILLWVNGGPVFDGNGTIRNFRVLLPLVLLPMALRHIRALRPTADAPALIRLLGDTGRLLALYALLLAVGLVVSRG